LFSDAGMICITAFISPYRTDRDMVRKILPPGRFVEVFVNAPLEVCEQRDPKGLYAKARSHEIKNFTGISAPYEPPLSPEIELRTDLLNVPQSVSLVLEHLHLAFSGRQRAISTRTARRARGVDPRLEASGLQQTDAITSRPIVAVNT